jgi:hypothetical protein
MWCLLPYSTALLAAVLVVRAAGDLRKLQRGEGLVGDQAASRIPEGVG